MLLIFYRRDVMTVETHEEVQIQCLQFPISLLKEKEKYRNKSPLLKLTKYFGVKNGQWNVQVSKCYALDDSMLFSPLSHG